MKSFLPLLFIYGLLTPVLGQIHLRPDAASASLRGLVSTTENMPFWLWAEQQGEVPYDAPAGLLALETFKDYDSLYTQQRKLKPFGLGYGVRAVASLAEESRFLLSNTYVKARYRRFQLQIGRWSQPGEILDKDRELGRLIWNNNSLPIPEIRLSVPVYTPLLKSGLLAFKGGYSHGWFGSTDSVQNYFLHQKSIYFRMGKPSWRIRFHAGANHQVQWGGKPTIPFFDKRTNQWISSYGNDFKTYMQVVSGISLNRNNEGETLNGVPYNEAFNRSGNHLGTLDIALDWETQNASFLLYRQSYYEDGSLFYLSNISDGLTGIDIRFKPRKSDSWRISHLDITYLDTRNQGGEGGSGNTIPELRGLDNYFNNGVYVDGWTYRNRFIGFPLLIPQSQYPSMGSATFPANFILNNRLQAGTVRLKGTLGKQTTWSLIQSYSVNFGNYSKTFPGLTQYSLLARLDQVLLPIWDLYSSYSLAFDRGELVGNQWGFSLELKKDLWK